MKTENAQNDSNKELSNYKKVMVHEQMAQTKLLESISKNVQFFLWLTILSLILGALYFLFTN